MPLEGHVESLWDMKISLTNDQQNTAICTIVDILTTGEIEYRIAKYINILYETEVIGRMNRVNIKAIDNWIQHSVTSRN